MNKYIARILALILTLNTVFSVTAVNVFAADPVVEFFDDISMTTGTADYTPVNLNSQAYNQSFIRFPITSSMQTMQLEYSLAKDTRILLTVSPPSNEKVQVEYRLQRYNNTTNNWFNPAYNPNNGQYLIYDPNATGNGYVDYTAINIPTGSPFEVMPGTVPTFKVAKGYGFSFKYNNRTMFFRWDRATDKFFFVTDGFEYGYIYDVKSIYGTSTPVHNYIFNGITDSFVNKPTANGKTKVAPPLQGEGTVQAGTGVETVIDMTDTNPFPIHPADKRLDAGMEFTFELPLVWDDNTRDFILPDNSTPLGKSLKSTVEIYTPEEGTVDIKLEKIFPAAGESTTMSVTAGGSSTITKNGEPTISGGTINLKLKGVKPGLIYHTSYVEFNSNLFKQTKRRILPFGTVYSFPEFFFGNDEFGNYSVYVNPYNYPGTYSLYIGNDENTLRLSAQSDGTPARQVLLPVSTDSVTRYYQVQFSPIVPPDSFLGGSKIYSQIAMFKPSEPNIATPQFFDITKTTMSPNFNSAEPLKEGLVDLGITWDIGADTTIKSLIDKAKGLNPTEPLIINYRLAYGTKPEVLNTGNYLPTGTPFDNSKAYDFLELKLTITMEGTPASPVYKCTYEIVGQNPDGIEIIGDVTDTTMGAREGVIPNTTRLMAKTRLYFSAGKVGTASRHIFTFPNIFYINIRPIACNVSTPTGVSKFRSFTLSDFDQQTIPAPQDFILSDPKIAADNSGSFKAEWLIPGKKLGEFLYNGSGIKFDRDTDDPTLVVEPEKRVKLSMNLYISQDENFMTNNFHDMNYDQRLVNSVKVTTPATVKTGDTLTLSGTGYLPVGDTKYADAREALRDKKVIRLADIPITSLDPSLAGQSAILNEIINNGSMDFPMNFRISGLDQNQRYFAYVDIVSENLNTKADGTADIPSGFEKIYASLSNLVGITTLALPDIPTGEDKVPSAPTVTVVPDSVTSSSAAVTWDKIPATVAGDVMEYQIIRLTDEQMKDKYVGKFDEIWSAIDNPSKLGFETNADVANKIQIWNGTNFVALNTEQATKYKYIPDVNATNAQFSDNSLQPNNIYFYYVRTVRKVGDKRLYSAWGQTTLTTKPVLAPINLKVEFDAEYDPKKEVVISFDAPVLYGDLGKKYQLQYRLKEDGKDWSAPVNMVVSRLNKPAATPTPNKPGFYHYTYKITEGLLSGTSYSVQVRLLDLELNDASMYSNIAIFRTEVDQGDYDEDILRKEWLDMLRKELEKLLRDPYWVIADTARELEVIYRPTMFDGLLNKTADGKLLLVGTEADKAVYYIPATALLSANAQNKGFAVTHGNMEIVIPPSAIDPNLNTAVIDALKDINNRSEPAKDYYVRLSLTWFQRGEQINMQPALSKQVEVRMEAVCSTIDNKTFDDLVLTEILNKIEEQLKDKAILEDIADEVEDGATDEEMVRFILELVGDVRDEFLDIASEKIDDVLDNSYEILSLKNPLLIAIKNIAAEVSAKAYQFKAGLWAPKELLNIGSGKGFYSLEPGIFIFAGSQLIVPGLNNIPNAGALTTIITKYNLDDFFGKGNAFNLDAQTGRFAAVASVARMMGAPKGSDPFAWLQTKGITLSTRSQSEPISTEEAVHMVMLLYENKTNTKLSAVQIRDFTVTNNMVGLDDRYKQAVRVAIQSGIYTNKNMQPKFKITVRDFLQMLAALDSKVKL